MFNIGCFCAEWSQTSNPVTDNAITGYSAINIPANYKACGGSAWAGLGLATGGNAGYTFLHANTAQSCWWGSVGSYINYQGGADDFPGPNNVVDKMELYVLP